MRKLNPATSDCLYHHGIKGMKWGVRRFRNMDGTLTPAGKKRYHSQSDLEALAPKTYNRVRKTGQRISSIDDSDVKRMNKVDKSVHNVANSVSDIARNGKPSNRYAGNHKTLTPEEMARTSDKELQQIINRLNMETNYTRLTEEPTAMDRIATGLQYVAAASTIAVSAATVYSVLKNK